MNKKRFIQNLDHPNPKTYVGTGKIADIAEYCKANEIDVALFDDELSPAQIRNIENEQRTVYTQADDIAVYVYFASGNANSDTSTTVTLGSAYQNTSIVIYEKTLQEVTNNVLDDLTRLEATTLHHEFGHIFGLVNIQNDDIHPGDKHEDPDHLKHCIIGDCLMYFEAQSITKNKPNI